jgi:hydroxyacylglutathione hydrolase
MAEQCACDKFDPSLWSVSQLKKFLETSGVAYHDCLEKSDFVEKAKACMLNSASGTSSSAHAAAAGAASDASFVFDSIAVGPLQCNCCLLVDTAAAAVGAHGLKPALLVDPGGDTDQIMAMIKRHDATVVQILITHGHFDHFLAAGDMKRAFPQAQLCLGRPDLPLWRALPMQCAMLGMKAPVDAMPEPDVLLDDGATLSLFSGRCIHTPGHSPGSCCFHFPAQKLLLSGDTLFKMSVGRTDLFGGSAKQLAESIQQKLYTLPADTKVVPGHHEFTTIGFEMDNNPVVKRSKI